MNRVLIVDDKQENRYMLRALLQGHGCEVVEASNGAESLIRAREALPDLVISDLLMPVMDGYTLLRQWKADEHLRKIPFVVYTATYTDPKDERLALDLGADAFIIKPLEPEPFWSSIQDILKKKESGTYAASPAPEIGETGFMQEYSEVLVRKLEKKVFQLEQLKRSLEEDITRRKRAEEALRISEKKYRSLFEESPAPICVNLVDGSITDANKAFEELFGYTIKELIGTSIIELYADPDDRPRFRRAVEETGFVKDYPIRFKKKDGTPVNCTTSASVQRSEDGTIAGYRGILRDLTVEQSLQAQLLQAQKMDAFGALAGGVAHDFNNILQVVLGYADFLLIDENMPQSCLPDLKTIYDSAKRGADLAKRLLIFSRKIETRPQATNLNFRITELLKMLERTIPKMIGIELLLAEDLAMIHADPLQMDQVLMNLAVNARDAMPEGGKLTIETANIEIDKEYARRHIEAKPGRYVLLTVTDTGTGMDEDTMGHIFEPFFTTKEPGKGTGLGLAIVHGIVKQHGGHVKCYSEPGRGTSFSIYLPRMVTDERIEEAEPRPMPRGGSETILLVDDEEDIRDLGSNILTKAGYKVITALNGKEALEKYIEHSDEIALVILDFIMPQIGGKKCLEGLLSINSFVKVIISSGYPGDGNTTGALGQGAKGFLNKPYDIYQMMEVVRKVLDEEKAA